MIGWLHRRREARARAVLATVMAWLSVELDRRDRALIETVAEAVGGADERIKFKLRGFAAITDHQIAGKLRPAQASAGLSDAALRRVLFDHFGVGRLTQLPRRRLDELLHLLDTGEVR